MRATRELCDSCGTHVFRMEKMPKTQQAPLKPCVKVFSATKHSERNMLGEQITQWLNQAPTKIVDKIETLQSSDSEFHCVSIVYFYRIES